MKDIFLDKCLSLSGNRFNLHICVHLLPAATFTCWNAALHHVRAQTHLGFGGQLNHRFPEVKFGVAAAHFFAGKNFSWMIGLTLTPNRGIIILLVMPSSTARKINFPEELSEVDRKEGFKSSLGGIKHISPYNRCSTLIWNSYTSQFIHKII